jgi:hypothetical protein
MIVLPDFGRWHCGAWPAPRTQRGRRDVSGPGSGAPSPRGRQEQTNTGSGAPQCSVPGRISSCPGPEGAPWNNGTDPNTPTAGGLAPWAECIARRREHRHGAAACASRSTGGIRTQHPGSSCPYATCCTSPANSCSGCPTPGAASFSRTRAGPGPGLDTAVVCDARGRAPHVDHSPVQVHVVPGERAQLAGAQAERDREHEQRFESAVRVPVFIEPELSAARAAGCRGQVGALVHDDEREVRRAPRQPWKGLAAPQGRNVLQQLQGEACVPGVELELSHLRHGVA